MIFKALYPHVKLPTKTYRNDAGFDCYLPKKIILEKHSCQKVDLGFSISLKKNECAIICARSSVASRNIFCNTSPVDCGYEGPVHAIVHNLNDFTVEYEEGLRICQIVIFKIPKKEIRFTNTGKRKSSSFGSSGRN